MKEIWYDVIFLYQEKVSVLSIETASEVTDPKLGVPNPTSQCATCGAKDVKSCEGAMDNFIMIYYLMNLCYNPVT